MREMRISICLILALFVCGMGQAPNDKDAPPRKSFDLEQTALPKNFNGQDFTRIYEALTSQGYVEELIKYNFKPEPLKEFDLGGFFYFSDNLMAKISESKSQMTVSDFGSGGDCEFSLSSDEKAESSYIGQNVYGATKEVRVKVVTSQVLRIANGLAVFGKDKGSISSRCAGFEKQFAIDPTKTVNPYKVKMLLIGKIVSPYTKGSSATVEPTFTSPVDATYDEKIIIFEVHEIWFYGNETGDIYNKLRFGSR